MRRVAEMLGQLGRQRPLHQPLGQLREHPARPDDLLLAASAGEQPVDHLVRETIANLIRQPVLERTRSAGRSLRSPSGLAPQPAGAIDPGGSLDQIAVGLGLRRHSFSVVPTQSKRHSPTARGRYARAVGVPARGFRHPRVEAAATW